MIFDTHTHAWGPPSPDHPWTNGPLVEEFTSHFSTDIVYTAEKLLADMDKCGVEEAVVVGYPITHWTDNWYTVKSAEENERLSAVVMIDQFAANAANRGRDLLSHDSVLGFRLGAVCPYDEMWERFDYDQTWLLDVIKEEAFWAAARDTDALVQIMAHTSQLNQALELVEMYPDLAYVFDHFAHADAASNPAQCYDMFERLTDFDRVGVKISEVAHLSNEPYPYEDTHDHLRWLLTTFGKERVIWGSDFPNVSHPEFGNTTYQDSLSWLQEVPFLSDRDREYLTGNAFNDLIGR